MACARTWRKQLPLRHANAVETDMGCSYMFECPRCYYRVVVAGGRASGPHCEIQTMMCIDCKALFDFAVRLRVTSEQLPGTAKGTGPRPAQHPDARDVINRLVRLTRSYWLERQPQCPNGTTHRLEPWSAPGPCPKCGTVLERTLMPYRVWD